MNLVEHYIRRIISATDISDRYEEGMKKYDPNYELKEPMYEVKLEYDCYGLFAAIMQHHRVKIIPINGYFFQGKVF